jgi:hypothetical protein
MNTVSHSKCKKCHKVLNVAYLKDREDGVGKVCVDSKSCVERIEKTVMQDNS